MTYVPNVLLLLFIFKLIFLKNYDSVNMLSQFRHFQVLLFNTMVCSNPENAPSRSLGKVAL